MADPRSLPDQSKRTPREELIDAGMEKLAQHLDSRCTSCGGTGVSIASQLDCRSCDGSGIRTGLEKYARADVAEIVDAMIARQMLHGFAENEVIQQAIRLCQDALGDEALWAATDPLREALKAWNGYAPGTEVVT